MKQFLTLVAMQLNERLHVSFNKKDIGKTLLKISLYILLFGAAVGLIYLILYLFSILGILGLGGFFPVSIFNIIFYLLMIVETISCIGRFTDAMFFSKDNKILLTFPVDTRSIFLSKLVVFYILELIRNIFMFIPLFVAYGILARYSFYFYPYLLLCFIVFSLVPIAIASVVSLGYMYFKKILERYPLAKGITILAVLVGLTVLIYYLITLLPEDLQLYLKWTSTYFPAITNFSRILEKYLLVFNFLPKMILNYDAGGTNNPDLLNICGWQSWLVLLATLVGSSLVIFVTSLITKRLFIKMASTSYEFNDDKVLKPDTKNTKRNALFSLIYKEVLLDFRTPNRLIGNYLLFAMTPMATLVLNAVFKAVHTSFDGTLYVAIINYLLISLIICSSNISVASIYSREEGRDYIDKTVPHSYALMMSSKLIVRAFLMVTSIIISMLIFNEYYLYTYFNFPLMLLSFLFIYLGHMFWSAELDFTNPKANLYKEMGHKGDVFNINETLSFIIAVILSIIVAALSALFILKDFMNGYTSLFIICLLFFVGRVMTFYKSISAYKNSIGN